MKTLLTVIIIILTGCGGAFRVADPVASYQYGDEGRTCPELKLELKACRERLRDLDKQRNEKIAANAIVGVVGAVFFWPALLFIDASDVDAIEIQAQRDRYATLAQICLERGCGYVVAPLPVEVKTNQKEVVKQNKDNH